MADRSDRTTDTDRAIIQAGFRYALSLTHNRHDSEDLVQQACLKVFKSLGRLSDKQYLFVTIRNLFIDSLRRAQRNTTDNLANDSGVLDHARNHVDMVNDRMEVEHLLSCLRFEEREILYLSCVEGYTAAEIGKINGQPRGTVLSQLARAKQKLTTRYGTVEVMQDDK